MGIKTGNLFDGLRKLMENINANPNKDVICYADDNGFLYGNEIKFLVEMVGKRKLTEKQQAWKRKINWRILNKKRIKK